MNPNDLAMDLAPDPLQPFLISLFIRTSRKDDIVGSFRNRAALLALPCRCALPVHR